MGETACIINKLMESILSQDSSIQPAPKKPTAFYYGLALLTAFLSIFFAVLMTEAGQILDLPRDWVVLYHQYRLPIIVLNLGLLAGLWWLNASYKFWRSTWMGLASIGVLLCVIAANFMLPTLFPAYQHTAKYVSIDEADKVLKDDDVVTPLRSMTT